VEEMARNHLEKGAVDRNTKFRCDAARNHDSDASASSLPTEMNIAGKSAVMLRTTDDSFKSWVVGEIIRSYVRRKKVA
jgi:hypothetical protein